MKKVIGLIKNYISNNFNWGAYLATFILTALLVSFNFYYDFEDKVIDYYSDSWIRVLWYFLIHILPYYAVVLLIAVFNKDYDALKKIGFWFFSIIGFSLLALDRGNPIQLDITRWINQYNSTFLFVFRMVNRWFPLFSILIPLALIYWLFLRKKIPTFYGIHTHELNLKPYFILLLLMVPLVTIASFQEDFLKQYPNYLGARPDRFIAQYDLPRIPVILGYEISYGFSFFIVELFFRGYLIFVLTRYLGEHVVLPMAVTYCVLHFGKPLGEAISSFFGGYILGILALKTKNIYGGIIIHVGIAWLMEIFAFLHI